MKRYLLFTVYCLLFTALAAQGLSEQKIIEKMTSAAEAIKTVRCNFTQTKHSKLFKEAVVSQGKMSYSRPDKLRWEYLSPEPFTLVVDGDSLTMLDAAGKPNRNANATRMVRGLTSMILGSINGDKLFDDRMFATQIFDDGKHYRAEMTPRRKEMQRMFQKITFLFDKNSHTISTVVMTERKGDATTIQFHHITIK